MLTPGYLAALAPVVLLTLVLAAQMRKGGTIPPLSPEIKFTMRVGRVRRPSLVSQYGRRHAGDARGRRAGWAHP